MEGETRIGHGPFASTTIGKVNGKTWVETAAVEVSGLGALCAFDVVVVVHVSMYLFVWVGASLFCVWNSLIVLVLLCL